MNLAIIESGGKQYLVSANTKIQVEKLAGKEGDIVHPKVLMVATDKGIELGKPYLSGSADVQAKILKQARSKKILVFKYKSKSRYRRKQGHRQDYTELEIVKI